LKFIGEGSTSKIFECIPLVDKFLKLQFAHKTKELNLDKGKRLAARVIKENDVWQVDETILNLNHPNLLKCNDVFHLDGHVFYICDLFDTDIKSVDLSVFSHKQKISWFLDVIKALDFLHKCNIFHGDIKPENILLRFQDNKVILCDYTMSNFISHHRTFKNTFPFITPFELYNQRFLNDAQEQELFIILTKKYDINIENFITFDRNFLVESGIKSDTFALGLSFAAVLSNMYSIFDIGMELGLTLEQAIQLRLKNYFEFLKDTELYLSLLLPNINDELFYLIVDLLQVDPSKRENNYANVIRYLEYEFSSC
jgi:serine/threonine protein kinase